VFEGAAWLRNAVDFPLRQLFQWRRRGCRLPSEAKEGLFAPDVLPEMERLVSTYGLQRWARESGAVDFAASLFYLQMLERAFAAAKVTLPHPVVALDAGPSDWFYVQALHGLLSRYAAAEHRSVKLDGVELDAFRIYRDLYSRHDWADAYRAGLQGVDYIPGDLRGYQLKVDLAFMLFPFLFPKDLRRWGLPRRYLQPKALLEHVYSLVRPGGFLVIANVGEAERIEQHRLLNALGLRPIWWAPHESPFFTYPLQRIVTVIRKGEDEQNRGTTQYV
jgi:hypothetical protein